MIAIKNLPPTVPQLLLALLKSEPSAVVTNLQQDLVSSQHTESKEQLVKAGDRSIHPPSSINELLPLLEQLENFLEGVGYR